MNKGAQLNNKNAEKYTEEKALEIGNKLIEWLRIENNIFYKEFLLNNNLYTDLVSDLCKKYDSFLELIKKAKEIQEMKLCKLGITGLINPTMTIFCLKNNHGYSDKKTENDFTKTKQEKPQIIFSSR